VININYIHILPTISSTVTRPHNAGVQKALLDRQDILNYNAIFLSKTGPKYWVNEWLHEEILCDNSTCSTFR
jgi:hypothetical protein